MASYQPADLSGIVGSIVPRIEHAVVRLYLPGERPSQDVSLRQIESVRELGLDPGGYFWAYPDFSPRFSVRNALTLADRAQLRLPVLWADCECYQGRPGPDIAWLREARSECEAQGVMFGIYTAAWYWQGFMGNTKELGGAPLWAAYYNFESDLDSVPLFGGWTRDMLWGHQYDTGEIDLDVFDPRACRVA